MGGEPGEGGTGRQGKATLALRISVAPMSLPLPWTGTVDTVSTSAPSAEHRLLVKTWELMLVCLTQQANHQSQGWLCAGIQHTAPYTLGRPGHPSTTLVETGQK